MAYPSSVDLSGIPEGWWLYGLFHNHTPIKFAGDRHEPFDTSMGGVGFAWTCKLQHVTGGLLTAGDGDTPAVAIAEAVAQAKIRQEVKG